MNSMQLMRRAGAVTLAALAAAASPAAAADKPVPCNGKPLGTDPAGDARVGFVGLVETPIAGGANTDFTSVFINNEAGKVTVNYSIADLNTEVPPDATEIGYRMTYDIAGVTNYLQVLIDSAGAVTYSYGHIDGTLIKDGDTTGALFEGKDGVISIVVPATHGGKTGAKWSAISAFSAYVRGRVNTQTDQVPDGDAELSYTANECPKGGSTPSTPPSSGGETPPPSGGGGGGGSTPPPSSQPPAGPTAPLKVTAKPTTLKLKKVKKAKKLKFALSSQEELTNVAVSLQKGGKSVGAGKLAKLGKAAKVTVKLAKKGLKKGAYTLVVTGRRADGSTGTAQISIKVR